MARRSSYPPFGKQYPGAALENVNVMRGIEGLGAGRDYLRYRTSAARFSLP